MGMKRGGEGAKGRERKRGRKLGCNQITK